MKKAEFKTSEEWQEQFKHLIYVMDPDGWDRKNFDNSWYKEKITKDEFFSRVCSSTCRFNVSPVEIYDMLNSGEI